MAKCWWERGTEDGPESSLRKLRIQQGDHELQTVKQGNQTVKQGNRMPVGQRSILGASRKTWSRQPVVSPQTLQPRPPPLPGHCLSASRCTEASPRAVLSSLLHCPAPAVTQSLSKEKMRPDEAPPFPSVPVPAPSG